jgi:hypothetical protein
MNDRLRKAINVKAMLNRKCNRYKSKKHAPAAKILFERYRKQRNLVNALKRSSKKGYFKENCMDSKGEPKKFWDTVSPFLNSKKSKNSNNFMLHENDKLVSDKSDVANIFNDFFVNVTNDLKENIDVSSSSVEEICSHYMNHPSIVSICENAKKKHFDFEAVTRDTVLKKLKCLNARKSCGYDLIPAKLLRYGAGPLSHSLTPIINSCFRLQVYPDKLKDAEVSPIYKKDDFLNKSNFRPVSVLTALSKVFESLMADQINEFFSDILSEILSAYRKQFSCNNVLIKCVETWRAAIDNNKNVACVMMDLSKAFDCLPHGLMIAKLNSYGCSESACSFILSYLTNRQQRVKIDNKHSSWLKLQRGVPQGSIIGPILFNIFLNDLFYMITDVDVFNYADDNTLSFQHSNASILKSKLELSSEICINWFLNNNMKANPNKFQAICFNKFGKSPISHFHIAGEDIIPEETVKLLGITFDNKLSFNPHISNLCKKASRQTNALHRISKYLDKDSRKNIYDSFITSNFTYCPVVWDNCGISNARKIETINKRALKIVHNDFDSTYKTLLTKSGKPMMYIHRKCLIVEQVYKIINSMAPPFNADFFEFRFTPYELRDSSIILQPRFSSQMYGFRSFRYQGAMLWNNLPPTMKSLKIFKEFQTAVRKWKGWLCQCGNCFQCTFTG